MHVEFHGFHELTVVDQYGFAGITGAEHDFVEALPQAGAFFIDEDGRVQKLVLGQQTARFDHRCCARSVVGVHSVAVVALGGVRQTSIQ